MTLYELMRDANYSKNHNEGVIDRIVEQLRDAGYTGTLSEMVDDVLDDAGECVGLVQIIEPPAVMDDTKNDISTMV